MTEDKKQPIQISLNPLKYPKPKILLLDLDKETEKTLKNTGYFIETGTLGTPYKVEKSNGYLPVIQNHHLPEHYAESEIIVVDFACSTILEKVIGERSSVKGETDYWGHCRYGIVDPRIVTARLFQKDFDKILYNGGIFIIFSDFLRQEIQLAYDSKDYGFQTLSKEPYRNLWCLLSLFEELEVEQIKGNEIQITAEKDSLIENLLAPHIEHAYFTCLLNPHYPIDKRFSSYAENKFGQSICGAFSIEKGFILIFPQIVDKVDFLNNLLTNILPEVVPKSFPFSESKNWIFREEYELKEVIKLKAEIEKIETETKAKIEEIKTTIENKRQEFSYLGDILTKTGDELVEAVIKTLDALGFKKVIDVDETLSEVEEKSRSKMEDIQILDYEPNLLVEVKGVGGLLTDDDALAVNKYVTARMREWKKTEIKGLTIVNHQRHLPPLDRENNNSFRDIILTNAEEHLIGLLTTWELYKLTRNFLKNNWKHKNIRDNFYKSGKIECLPTNYEYIGKVERFIEEIGVAGIKIENTSLNKNDKIAFETEIEFEEQIAESLQIENAVVENANISDLVGIKTHLTKKQIRLEKTRVFRVN